MEACKPPHYSRTFFDRKSRRRRSCRCSSSSPFAIRLSDFLLRSQFRSSSSASAVQSFASASSPISLHLCSTSNQRSNFVQLCLSSPRHFRLLNRGSDLVTDSQLPLSCDFEV
ncbi:hypothetical protein RYX36_017436 [Vicia faba]